MRPQTCGARLTWAPAGAHTNLMPDNKEKGWRLGAPRLSYTTKVHLKRRARAVDYGFVAAVIALIAATVAIIYFM